MKSSEKVLLAMSGGVDSSVAAALLLEQGYRVTGVFMCIGLDADSDSRGCCSPQDSADARRVADKLGIDMHVLNVAESFGTIIDYFTSEYLRGRTPNPCIVCNSTVKFGRLFHHADTIGARYVATGHHARIVPTGAGAALARGKCTAKDQSYALFAVARERLGRMLLPVGEIEHKDRIREIAKSLGLNVHDKPDSQEICFVPDDDYPALLQARVPEALTPGNIVDSSGRVLGRHDGYARYTIGQRRRLGVAMGHPMYVTHVDPATATVTIGPREEVMSTCLCAEGASWQQDVPASFDAIVQIRYNNRGASAHVTRVADDAFDVRFHEPLGAITPGQAAVVYDGDTVLGGGWIADRR